MKGATKQQQLIGKTFKKRSSAGAICHLPSKATEAIQIIISFCSSNQMGFVRGQILFLLELYLQNKKPAYQLAPCTSCF